jgi:hypothetical protein
MPMGTVASAAPPLPYNFENAPIIRPSICLDAVSMASTYPNWATIANATVTTSAPGLTNPIRGLTQGGLVIRSIANSPNSLANANTYGSGNGSANAVVGGSSQIFAYSTEANIATTKTFANIGAFPFTPTGQMQVLYAAGFYCPITSIYYFALRFQDSQQYTALGDWLFSINPATGATVLIYNSTTQLPFLTTLCGGDGTNFVGAAQTASYYNASGTAVGSLPTPPNRNNSPSGGFVGQAAYVPLIVNTKLWYGAAMFEGGGNNSLLIMGQSKWAGGAPVTAKKLVGGGAGSLLLPNNGGQTGNTGAIIASATSGCSALLVKSSLGEYQLFDVALP